MRSAWIRAFLSSAYRRSGGGRDRRPFLAKRPKRMQYLHMVETERQERECPSCAEMVLTRAVVCKHCGRDLPPVASVAARRDGSRLESSEERESRRMNAVRTRFRRGLLAGLKFGAVAVGLILLYGRAATREAGLDAFWAILWWGFVAFFVVGFVIGAATNRVPEIDVPDRIDMAMGRVGPAVSRRTVALVLGGTVLLWTACGVWLTRGAR